LQRRRFGRRRAIAVQIELIDIQMKSNARRAVIRQRDSSADRRRIEAGGDRLQREAAIVTRNVEADMRPRQRGFVARLRCSAIELGE